MKHTKYLILLIFAVAVGLVGCRAAPVMNVEDAPVTVVGGKASLEDVGKAIIRAGGSLGWQIKKVKPGHMVGTLQLRDHVAVVDIKYSSKSYSIIYKDSTNLSYDGTNIHSNYNGWVQNLDNNIQVQLNTM